MYQNDAWHGTSPATQNGAATNLKTLEETLSLTGASVLSVMQIPNRAIVLAVSVVVIETVEGATSFDVGVAGEVSKFGGSLGTNTGDENIGAIGPTAFYAPTPIIITANGSNFTAGTVRIALHTIECLSPNL